MTTEPTNTDRAEWARVAVVAMWEEVGPSEIENMDAGNWEGYYLSDLLANLRHLADGLGLDWPKLLTSGDMHYDAEIREQRENEAAE